MNVRTHPDFKVVLADEIRTAVAIEREECARTVIDLLECYLSPECTSALNLAVRLIRDRGR